MTTQFTCAKNRAKGFTLAELTLALIIISIIMVALAPVVTKRVADNIKISNSTLSEFKLYTYDEAATDSKCTPASDGSRAYDCEFSAPSSAKSVSVVMVSGGGGGAGATNATLLPTTNSASNSSSTANTTKEIEITNGIKNVVVSYLSGSGGGGGGGSWSESAGAAPTSQADCDKYDAKFLTAAQNGGTPVCVTKYNIGDIPSATNGGIATSVTTTTVSTNSYCLANTCCWQGKTASPCYSSGTSYSGCNRTVCTWYAGDASCQALAYNGTKAGDWRLPTKNELSKWASNINTINKNKGDNGLRLCDFYNGYGAAQCNYYNVCDGANADTCYPYDVWSSTPDGGRYYYFYLVSGSFDQSSHGPRHAGSVRCVLEKTAPSNTSLSGGGGSSAPYFKNYTIPQDILDSNIGGKIVMYAAAGGAGGSSASSKDGNGSNGSNGSDSYIAIYDKDGTLKWGLKASGGNGGKGASSSAGGAGGTQKAANTCQIYQNGAWTATNCSGAGASGSSGQSVSGANETNAANGGAGGGSMYSSDSYSGGGAGGSAGSVNGSKGSTWGSGGGGATVGFNSSGTEQKGKGGNGANGVVELKYDVTYQAAAGGGGGGGAFVKLRDVFVTPSTVYTIRVGGGGNGGNSAIGGSDGGDSSASFGAMEFVAKGGKGGKVGSSDASGATHGVGGEGGQVVTSLPSKGDSEYRIGKKGSDGQNATDGSSNSWGGRGGESGIRVKGGCGGLYTNVLFCSNPDVNGISPTFSIPDNISQSAEYGSAGAGGGGGGWSSDSITFPNPGSGAKGQDGYVYIYWTK